MQTREVGLKADWLILGFLSQHEVDPWPSRPGGAKQLRWAEFFFKFRFTLKHLPRKFNFLADALWRPPQCESQREEVMDTVFMPAQFGGGVDHLQPEVGYGSLPPYSGLKR